MRRLALVVLFATVLLGPLPARSESMPSPEAMAAAHELIVANHAADQFKSALPLIMQQLKPLITQGRSAVEKDYDTIMPALIASAAAQMDLIIDAFALIYARNFSVDELRDLTAFYRTPTGQKVVAKLPVIMQESMLVGQKIGQQIAGDLQNHMVDELRKRGHDIKI